MAFGDRLKSAGNWASDKAAAPGFGSYARHLQDSAKKLREGDLRAFGPGEEWEQSRKATMGSDIHKQVDAASENLLEGMAAQGGANPDGNAFKMAGTMAGEVAGAAAKEGLEVGKQAVDIAMANKAQAQKALQEERMANKQMISDVLGGVDDNLDKAIAKGKVVGAEGGVQKLTGKALQVALMAARLGLVCWVAREVLPSRWKDCRTYILFGSPRWFCKWYSENGERAAEWLRAHPWAKVPLRPLFRYFAWRGRKMAAQNPELIKLQSHLA